jgi:hypothetical protein
MFGKARYHATGGTDGGGTVRVSLSCNAMQSAGECIGDPEEEWSW